MRTVRTAQRLHHPATAYSCLLSSRDPDPTLALCLGRISSKERLGARVRFAFGRGIATARRASRSAWSSGEGHRLPPQHDVQPSGKTGTRKPLFGVSGSPLTGADVLSSTAATSQTWSKEIAS